MLHGQGISAEPRALLRQHPHLVLREATEAGVCCGSAGIYNLVQPEEAAELGRIKAADLGGTGAELVASANIGCSLQIRRHLAEGGHPRPCCTRCSCWSAAGGPGRQRRETAMSRDAPNLAVLIDSDNAQAAVISDLLTEVAQVGTATVKRAYGDWTTPQLGSWKDVLNVHAIVPVQQFSYTSGKNATDSALIIDAMDLLHSGRVDGFCLVSSDSDFTRLATRIREQGLLVIGFGERKTPKAFVAACDRFLYTDILKRGGGGGSSAGSAPAPLSRRRGGPTAAALPVRGDHGRHPGRRLGAPRHGGQPAAEKRPRLRRPQLRLPQAERTGEGPGVPRGEGGADRPRQPADAPLGAPSRGLTG